MGLASFGWKPSYSVGNEKLDAAHQLLVTLMTELEQAAERGESSEHISLTIEALIAYADSHFTFEELLMTQHKYDGFELHKRQHDRFRELCLQLRGTEPTPELALQILSTLREWFAAHVLELDKDLGRYLL